jgi:hypothetical protein
VKDGACDATYLRKGRTLSIPSFNAAKGALNSVDEAKRGMGLKKKENLEGSCCGDSGASAVDANNGSNFSNSDATGSILDGMEWPNCSLSTVSVCLPPFAVEDAEEEEDEEADDDEVVPLVDDAEVAFDEDEDVAEAVPLLDDTLVFDDEADAAVASLPFSDSIKETDGKMGMTRLKDGIRAVYLDSGTISLSNVNAAAKSYGIN